MLAAEEELSHPEPHLVVSLAVGALVGVGGHGVGECGVERLARGSRAEWRDWSLIVGDQ